MNTDQQCRRCSECKGMTHHWMPDPDPSHVGDYACKHCDVRGDECENCCGSGSHVDGEHHCIDCQGEGVVECQDIELLIAEKDSELSELRAAHDELGKRFNSLALTDIAKAEEIAQWKARVNWLLLHEPDTAEMMADAGEELDGDTIALLDRELVKGKDSLYAFNNYANACSELMRAKDAELAELQAELAKERERLAEIASRVEGWERADIVSPGVASMLRSFTAK